MWTIGGLGRHIGWQLTDISVDYLSTIGRQSTDYRSTVDSWPIVDRPSPMVKFTLVLLFVWAWQVLHSEYSDLYVKASNSLSKPFKKGTNCILIVGWNNWEEDWQEMCSPSKVCKVISRPAFWIKITWPFKKKIMLSLWFLKFIFCFWYCGIFYLDFLNIIFLISRSTEISGDSAWETILENEESHQEVIDTNFFYKIFYKIYILFDSLCTAILVLTMVIITSIIIGK